MKPLNNKKRVDPIEFPIESQQKNRFDKVIGMRVRGKNPNQQIYE